MMANDTIGPVLVALATMQGNVNHAQKEQAHKFLENFQKSASHFLTSAYVCEGADCKPSLKHGRPRMPYSLRRRRLERRSYSLQPP